MSEIKSLELRVSVDVGSRRHSVAVGLPDGRVLEEFEITHGPEWPISRNVPTQFQRRDPPDFTEGTHPISGGTLRFLS